MSADLTPVTQKFILHWGEMGTRWGINRSVAQIHALLYVSPEPLNAEEIASTLKLARSNVSNSLRELTGWGLVRGTHLIGDRRDYFTTLDDPWEIFHVVMTERKRRELDPTLTVLAECVDESEARPADALLHERLTRLHDLLQILSRWYEQICKLPRPLQLKLLRMGSRIQKLLGGAS